MQVLTAYHTDIGTVKKTNQDSLCIHVAEAPDRTAVLAVVCDGMGGLSKGELASASVIRAFDNWFEEELLGQMDSVSADEIRSRWAYLIQEQNLRIGAFGRANRMELGTTLTALLLMEKQFFVVAHVGDTRAYRIAKTAEQLTEDQTVVGREILQGILTPEEAEEDPRRNILLQCIGASKTLRPSFVEGVPRDGDVFLLCSDGFRHKVSAEEIAETFSPEKLVDEAIMTIRIKKLIELNKKRREKDNITALLVKLD